MANKKIKYLNYLRNNNLLVHETKSVCQDEIAWIVLSSCEGQDNDYSFKIRTECFKKDDIENGYDVIGNHSFSEYKKKKMSLSNGVFSIFLMWSSTVVANASVLCITIRSGTVGVST